MVVSDGVESRKIIIRDYFEDNNEMDFVAEMHGGDLFKSSTGESVFFDVFYGREFGVSELLKYVKIAEELYSEYGRRVNLYLLATSCEVSVDEFDVPSSADFTIKLSVCDIDICGMILSILKERFDENGGLDSDDVEMLGKLSLMCDESEREFYLREYIDIVDKL